MSQKVKSTLGFFSAELSEVNNKRIQLNRSKGLAKYLAKAQKKTADISSLDTSMGIMSFSLYLMRFAITMGLLVELTLADSIDEDQVNRCSVLGLSLLNDSLWGAVNLCQFFWLSFSKSSSAGMLGLQLETIAQLVDVLVMLIRIGLDKQEFDRNYQQATGQDRDRLVIEWQNKQRHLLRSLLAVLSMALAYGLYSFSVLAFSLSPVLSVIVLFSSLSRVLLDRHRDRQIILSMELNGSPPQLIQHEQLERTKARLKDINYLILTNLCLPLAVFLLITTPFPVAFFVSISLLMIYYLANQLIDENYQSLNSSPLAPRA